MFPLTLYDNNNEIENNFLYFADISIHKLNIRVSDRISLTKRKYHDSRGLEKNKLIMALFTYRIDYTEQARSNFLLEKVLVDHAIE